MKDETTHLAYNAEHVVDLDSNLIMAAEVDQRNQADVSTREDSVNAAQTNQAATGSDVVTKDVVADKGYGEIQLNEGQCMELVGRPVATGRSSQTGCRVPNEPEAR